MFRTLRGSWWVSCPWLLIVVAYFIADEHLPLARTTVLHLLGLVNHVFFVPGVGP